MISGLLLLEPSPAEAAGDARPLAPAGAAAPGEPFAPAVSDSTSAPRGFKSQVPSLLMVAVAIAVGALLIRSVHEVPGLLIAYGRYAATRVSQVDEIIYKGE